MINNFGVFSLISMLIGVDYRGRIEKRIKSRTNWNFCLQCIKMKDQEREYTGYKCELKSRGGYELIFKPLQDLYGNENKRTQDNIQIIYPLQSKQYSKVIFFNCIINFSSAIYRIKNKFTCNYHVKDNQQELLLDFLPLIERKKHNI